MYIVVAAKEALAVKSTRVNKYEENGDQICHCVPHILVGNLFAALPWQWPKPSTTAPRKWPYIKN